MESYQVILNPIESHSAAFDIGVIKDKWELSHFFSFFMIYMFGCSWVGGMGRYE